MARYAQYLDPVPHSAKFTTGKWYEVVEEDHLDKYHRVKNNTGFVVAVYKRRFGPVVARLPLVEITTAAVPGAAEHDPSGRDQHAPGAKLDAGKLRPALVMKDFARALEAVVKVGTDGANKYTDGGWLEVPNGFVRYDDAARRHTLKRDKGESHDTDSGSLHLAHEAWNALARLELYLREQETK